MLEEYRPVRIENLDVEDIKEDDKKGPIYNAQDGAWNSAPLVAVTVASIHGSVGG